MRLLSISIFLCIAVFLLAVFVQTSQGFVLLVLQPYRVELPLNVFILLAVLTLFALILSYHVFQFLTLLPSRYRAAREKKRQEKAVELLNQALVCWLEGQYQRAASAAIAVFEAGLLLVPTGLVAARSYHYLGAYEKRDAWLEKVASVPQGERAQRLTAAELYLDVHDANKALKSLQPITEGGGVHVDLGIARLFLHAYTLTENWSEVLKYLRILNKWHAIPVDVSNALKTKAYPMVVLSMVTQEQLVTFWKSVPSGDQIFSRYAVVCQAIEIMAFEFARQQIEKALLNQWDSQLIIKYADCSVEAKDQQLEFAESCLKKHHDDANLFICLARLCERRSLWGKAKQYLERAMVLSPSQSTQLELAHLLDKLGDHVKANIFFRQALQKLQNKV